MSDPPLSRAAESRTARCRESSESGETFLCSERGWKHEAEAVIRDVENFVKKIEIAGKIESGPSHIFLNLTTLENKDLTVELSSAGFRVVSTRCHDEVDTSSSSSSSAEQSSVFETPYSLLESVSPAYVAEFGKALAQRLSTLQNE